MTDKNKRNEGNAAESAAVAYLENNGYKIIGRNFYSKMGEVDIICISPQDHLVFAEVKFRTSNSSGDPLEAVNPAKQKKICRSSLVYLSKNPQYSDYQIRYDVIAIYGNGDIRHIENAFEYLW